jgi:uncharacterized protein (DUF1697 family)
MHRYVAFLGGINLGRRRVKMDHLRSVFEEMGFAEVATFIASGNIAFATKSSNASQLQQKISQQLESALGYPVKTFVRTRGELADIASFPAFPADEVLNPANTIHVALLSEALDRENGNALVSCRTAVDEFRVNGREFYWLCRIKTSDSTVWTSPAMKQIRLPECSLRNLTTIRKMAALFPPVKK